MTTPDLEKGDAPSLTSVVIETVHSNTFPDALIASQAELTCVKQAAPLPETSSSKIYGFLRWKVFNVYRKMFTIVLLGNLAALVVFLYQLKDNKAVVTFDNAATAASANFCLSLLMRNEHVVNFIFRAACILPHWVPLAIRRRVAKVYSYGGIHSGCSVSGTIWYITFSFLVAFQNNLEGAAGVALAMSTSMTLFLLVLILIFAYPTMRARMHNHFETTHRYGGWSAIALLWGQTMILVYVKAQDANQTFHAILIRTPGFWCLVVMTFLLIYPWTRLRLRPCQVEPLSAHAARLHFRYREVSTCMAVRLTDSPLRETHAFATIPNYEEDEKGYSVLISNAGDWTKKIINSRPKHIYIKGAPTIGVMRVALMFKKVLIVATGSGIGPSMSLMQAHPDYPMRLLWSTKNPLTTYGNGVLRTVFRADPNAMVIDTQKTGRPDMVGLAYALYVQSECEAVIVISNPALTKEVVFGLERRGVPAFGPIFDS
ncbi:hypothetical protein ANO11243_019390 [Dothideomycetidae sp. 11243]|nr:hypothetical protein ANO11243_019390 [fungal sp. No.11243]